MKQADVEDLYALSPLQQGMLFHMLQDPEGGVYFEQFVCRLRGDLDRIAFERAWQRVVDRHPVLRTAFVWQGVRQPVQVVRRSLEIRVAFHDWRALPAAEQERHYQAFLAADLAQGFELNHAPLTRLTLMRLAAASHRFVFSYPHLLLDGWSLPLVVIEVLSFYEAFARGEELELPRPRPYRDYILWLREQDRAAAEDYWRRTLDGFTAANRIGLAPPRPVPAAMTDRYMRLTPEVTAALEALARRHRLTLNTVVQGAWAIVLGRYSGDDDVVFGTTSSGRPADLGGVEGIVGLFINTVPVRVRLRWTAPLFAWLGDLQDRQGERLRYQVTPLWEIRRWSCVASGQPLFETLLVFENYPVPPASGGGREPSLRLEEPNVVERTNYPLALGVGPGEQLVTRACHDRSRITVTAVDRILGHLRRLLEGMAADPEARLGALPLMSRAERHQLTAEYNDFRVAYPSDLPAHRLFESWVLSRPSAEAVIAGQERLTYGELNLRANRLAHLLRGLGVGPEVLVGIHLERSAQLPVAILGVLKAGGAFLPLDPSYPRDRLAFMLADSGARVVLTESRTADLPPRAARVVTIDSAELRRQLAREREKNPDAGGLGADNLAYVIYTSGSTGRPKGVELAHRGLTNLASTLAHGLGCAGPGDRVLQFSALSFDASVWETFMAFGAGAALVLAPPPDLLPGEPLRRLLADRRITAVTLPPSALAVLPPAALPALRSLVAAGEACGPELVDRWAGGGRRFWNAYGPTETTVCATAARCLPGGGKPSIGRPIDNVRVHVGDRLLRLAPRGSCGELLVAGTSLARGYRGRPALSAERFVPDPFGEIPGGRLYRTGDLVRRLPGGEIDFLGRVDHQVKVRGFRIEPEEVVSHLRKHPGVREAVVAVGEGDRLTAWWVPREAPAPAVDELRRFLGEQLPAHMVPDVFVPLEALPLTPSGKVDRRALPAPELAGGDGAEPRSDLERTIAGVWQELLEIDRVGVDQNFFDLGGHSLLMVRIHSRLQEILEREIPMVDLLWYPTVRALAERLGTAAGAAPARRGLARAQARQEARRRPPPAIAVVGMAGRFPGADDPQQFWRNLRDGVESITFFSDEELAAAGVASEMLRNPAYVKARGVLERGEWFDHALFGFSPREAQILDPQHRVLLECAWEALESAGYDPRRCGGAIGLWAGAAMNTYWIHVVSNPELRRAVDPFYAMLGNDKDFLTTRISYKLNLKGPSVDVQTACSTSLVAIHLACQSLRDGECDLALAGGVTVSSPRQGGHFFQEEGIFSPDGHCRAFDARAAGTVGGEGAGLVVLKPLDRALADGDCVRAVIRGSAINNDGSFKVGFTAPSVEAQAEVVGEALEIAGVEPETIGFLETHGTGTALGDPIEIAALHEVFRPRGARQGYCALGAVKTNIGHTDAAAGIAGLLKAVLALEAGILPPTLHFERPNPRIDWTASPFFVPTEARAWPAGEAPRRAGVSSFGIGGTNAHVVLEQAPEPEPSGPSRPWQLLTVSALAESALAAATERLAAHLEIHPDQPLADVAFTLNLGRQPLPRRRIAICRDREDAVRTLREPERWLEGVARDNPAVTFLFSGLGDHSLHMGRELYATEPVFRRELDRCAELAAPTLGCDLREVLYPGDDWRPPEPGPAAPDLRRLLGRDRGPELGDLRETRLAHPAVFAVEIALARLWMAWGVEPRTLIGYSLGEFGAACIAGVLPLAEALALVTERARLIAELPTGAMLAVPLPEAELRPRLGEEVSLSATNGPHLSVVAGPEPAVARLHRELGDLPCQRLRTSHAFHSRMMEPIAERFRAAVAKCALRPPRIPYLSNVTGDWIRAEQATDPDYWVRHLCCTVRFGEGLEKLFAAGGGVLLEVGPGQALATTARQHPAGGDEHLMLGSLRDPREPISEPAFLLRSVGQLWLAGVPIDWEAFYRGERRRRVPLPTYAFQRRRFWVEPGAGIAAAAPVRRRDPADWFYLPSWQRSATPEPAAPTAAEDGWLIFADGTGLAAAIAERLGPAVLVRAGERFVRLSEREFEIDPRERTHYDRLLAELDRPPRRLAHCWSLDAAPESWERIQERGFFSLLWLAQALGRRPVPAEGMSIFVVCRGLHAVLGEERVDPDAATVLGICLGIPREMPGVSCRSIEIEWPAPAPRSTLIAQLAAELGSAAGEPIVAWRGRHRWVRTYEPVRWNQRPSPPPRLRAQGTYLITGGLGGMGLAFAGYLGRAVGARLALVQRRAFPGREQWGAWLEEHGEDDDESRRIRTLEAIEAAGAQLMVLRADVSDREQMARVAAEVRERFGRIDGIIHAAGVPGGGLIQSQEPDRVAEVFAPKIAGARNLAQLFAGEADFLVVCSSLVSVVGLPDRAEYAAANAFLDAFAERPRDDGIETIAVNWDSWYGTAMGIDAAAGDLNGLSTEEGVEALVRVLHRHQPRVVVSTLDLPRLIEHYQTSSPLDLHDPGGPAATAPAHPRPRLATPYAGPRNQAEETLARIWAEVLGVESVGIHDGFLQLGGDSILGLRVIARARQEGIYLSLAQMFERPTIAQLAACTAAAVHAEQGPVVGPAPLTPIQAWFFELDLPDPQHWNQSILFELREAPDRCRLDQAVAHLMHHHDALRMRYERGSDEEWRQLNAPPAAASPLAVVDLSRLADAARSAALETAAPALQGGFDLAAGPLLRIVLFDFGRALGRLLLLAHHLVIDAVSWRIVLEDLETAYAQLIRGEAAALPAKTTSFKEWAEGLAAHARSGVPEDEQRYWRDRARGRVPPLPVDFPGGANTVRSRQTITATLAADDTRALTSEIPQRYGTEINDALLSALAIACRAWTGPSPLLLDLEGHGREALVEALDVSRTVGWFTTLFPVLLRLDDEASEDPGKALWAVRDELRGIPRRGIGYGLLRYLSDSSPLRRELAEGPRPDLVFVFLGQLDGGDGSRESLLAPASESAGPEHSVRGRRTHLLEVSATIAGSRLTTSWSYSENLHRRQTIAALAEGFLDALRRLIRHGRAAEEGDYAPSHFPRAELSPGELDDLIANLEMPEE